MVFTNNFKTLGYLLLILLSRHFQLYGLFNSNCPNTRRYHAAQQQKNGRSVPYATLKCEYCRFERSLRFSPRSL